MDNSIGFMWYKWHDVYYSFYSKYKYLFKRPQKCILDINDCQPNPCSENCNQNAPGQGYNCSCAPGKKLDIDQRSCIGKKIT